MIYGLSMHRIPPHPPPKKKCGNHHAQSGIYWPLFTGLTTIIYMIMHNDDSYVYVFVRLTSSWWKFAVYAQDILSPLGFLRHVYAAMNLKQGGVLWAGVVCSTWSVVNRGTSGRTKDEPLGREQLGYILYKYKKSIFIHMHIMSHIYIIYRSPSLQWAQVLQKCETRQSHASSWSLAACSNHVVRSPMISILVVGQP